MLCGPGQFRILAIGYRTNGECPGSCGRAVDLRALGDSPPGVQAAAVEGPDPEEHRGIPGGDGRIKGGPADSAVHACPGGTAVIGTLHLVATQIAVRVSGCLPADCERLPRSHDGGISNCCLYDAQ